jgi:hypothetical protein
MQVFNLDHAKSPIVISYKQPRDNAGLLFVIGLCLAVFNSDFSTALIANLTIVASRLAATDQLNRSCAYVVNVDASGNGLQSQTKLTWLDF